MKTMNLNAIRIDGGTQQRAVIDQETVEQYAELVKEGVEFPPVTVYFDGSETWLADGFHRWHAHKAAGKASIATHMIPGSQRDAILHSLGANATHGLRRSQDDKRKAVMTMLEDFEWSDWSDREIARRCNVSVQLVQAVKHELKAGEKVSAAKMNNKNVRKKKPEVIEADVFEVDETPDESIKELIEENVRLADRVAVAAMQGTEEEKKLAEETISDLREKVRVLEIELASVKISRDTFQTENAQMKKQIQMLNKKIKSLEK